MKTRKADLLVIRRWLFVAVWTLLAVSEGLLLHSIWGLWYVTERIATALVLLVPAGIMAAGAIWIGAEHEPHNAFTNRVEARRPRCLVFAGVSLTVEFVLWLTAIWVDNGKELAQTGGLFASLTALSLLMCVDWSEW